MFGHRILAGPVVLLVLVVGIAPSYAAVIFSGSDDDYRTPTNSLAAFDAWRSTLAAYEVEPFDGLSGNVNSQSTPKGNTFTAGANTWVLKAWTSSPQGLLEGTFLDTVRTINATANQFSFTWQLATPSDSFGLFGTFGQGRPITIEFTSGSTQHTYVFQPLNTLHDGFFWGISGLPQPVSSVTITVSYSGTSHIFLGQFCLWHGDSRAYGRCGLDTGGDWHRMCLAAKSLSRSTAGSCEANGFARPLFLQLFGWQL